MEEKSNQKSRHLKFIILLVSLLVIGVSTSYAFFRTTITGDTDTNKVQAANLKIDTDLDAKEVINNNNLDLIDESQIDSKADSLNFSLTNNSESNISGSYNVYLREVKLSKNLYSNYFKWELLKSDVKIASGDFSSASRSDNAVEGEDSRVETSANDIKLLENPIDIAPGETHNLTFRIYLLNDNVNQIDLTEGTFSGKLNIQATPKSQNS